MLTCLLVFTVLNSIILCGIVVHYFRSNYVILDIETYNTLAETYNQAIEDEESHQELAGGCGVSVGFGADYLEDDEEEDE